MLPYLTLPTCRSVLEFKFTPLTLLPTTLPNSLLESVKLKIALPNINKVFAFIAPVTVIVNGDVPPLPPLPPLPLIKLMKLSHHDGSSVRILIPLPPVIT